MNQKLKEFNHVDLLFPSKYLKAADLRGKDVTVTISDIDPRGELQMRTGKKEYKPLISMKGTEKLLCLNKTNGHSIAKVYGPEVMNWIGKRITLYPTKVQCGGQTVDAIRVREHEPKPATTKQGQQAIAAAEAAERILDAEPAHDPVTGEVTSASTIGDAAMAYTDGNEGQQQ